MKSIKFLFVLALIIVIAPSCTKLEEEPFSDLVAGNYYQDKASVIAALVRPYEHGHWNGWDGDRWLLSELTADNFVWTQKGKHGYDEGNWIRLHTHNWTAEQGQINGGWVGPYQGISQCNIIINDMARLDYPALGSTLR